MSDQISTSTHLQRPTPSAISKNAPSLQDLSHAGVARSRRRPMISAVKPDEPHQTYNNVTTPFIAMDVDQAVRRLAPQYHTNACLLTKQIGASPRPAHP